MSINELSQNIAELADTIGNYQDYEEFTREEIENDLNTAPLGVLLWLEDLYIDDPYIAEQAETCTEILKAYIKYNEL